MDGQPAFPGLIFAGLKAAGLSSIRNRNSQNNSRTVSRLGMNRHAAAIQNQLMPDCGEAEARLYFLLFHRPIT